MYYYIMDIYPPDSTIATIHFPSMDGCTGPTWIDPPTEPLLVFVSTDQCLQYGFRSSASMGILMVAKQDDKHRIHYKESGFRF